MGQMGRMSAQSAEIASYIAPLIVQELALHSQQPIGPEPQVRTVLGQLFVAMSQIFQIRLLSCVHLIYEPR